MSGESRDSGTRSGGLLYALGAYGLWGLLPLYLVLLNAVDPFELVAWRVLFTLPLCVVLALAARQMSAIRAAFADRRGLALLTIGALMLSVNWMVYVIAVQRGYFYAASLGYYINPLINVLLGTVFLKERLGRMQWVAVALAASGIAVLAWEADATLAISLALAVSFSIYGLIRKVAAAEALPGLTVEVVVLTLPAIAVIAWVDTARPGFGDGLGLSLLLAGAGVMTAVPLLLFAAAARRMRYSTLGFVQFLAPTVVFLLGLTVFGQPLRSSQLVCFTLIWSAVVVFSWDLLARGRRARASAATTVGDPV